MKKFIILFLVILTYLLIPNKIFAETPIDYYMNDFYSKSNEAKQILREIEIKLKQGSRDQVCSKQRKAAKLALLANESLFKAFELKGIDVPFEAINNSNKRWESILNEC